MHAHRGGPPDAGAVAERALQPDELALQPEVGPDDSGDPSVPDIWLAEYDSEHAHNVDRLAADVELHLHLALHRFTGADYEEFRVELTRYGLDVMTGWLRSRKIFIRMKEKGWGLPEADFDLLDREAQDELAHETVATALHHFHHDVLLKGKWNPGKGARLTTYFIGQCLMRFANIYRAWLRHEVRSPDLLAPHDAEEWNDSNCPFSDDPQWLAVARTRIWRATQGRPGPPSSPDARTDHPRRHPQGDRRRTRHDREVRRASDRQPPPPHQDLGDRMTTPDQRTMSELIDRSSLGAPDARRARSRVSAHRARQLLLYVDEAGGSQTVGGQSGLWHYTSGDDAVRPRMDDATPHRSPDDGREGEAVRKTYPATKSGLRRLGRDMQAELEKSMNPINIPVRYQYAAAPHGVTASPWAGTAPMITNNHYGDVVSVGGDHNVVAVGNHGTVHQTVEQAADQWRMELLAALGNVQSRLEELNLDEDDRDTIEDAAASVAAIASEQDGEGDDTVDDTALRRRGRKVLQILEKVATSAGGGVLAHELADPLQQLLS